MPRVQSPPHLLLSLPASNALVQSVLGSQAPLSADKTFSSYYQGSDYPLVRLLQEPVYIEVRLLQRTDPGLALMLHQCWATPSASPFEQPQWPILSDG